MIKATLVTCLLTISSALYAGLGAFVTKHPYVVIAAGAIAAGGCGYSLYQRTNYMTYAYDVICGSFVPITVSKSDTLKTLKQVIEYNAVWDEFCGEDEIGHEEPLRSITVEAPDDR